MNYGIILLEYVLLANHRHLCYSYIVYVSFLN